MQHHPPTKKNLLKRDVSFTLLCDLSLGTAVSYTFLQDHDGSTAQILIDGKQVDAVNTNNPTTEADTDCVQITKSVAVASGDHTITAVNQVTANQFVMYFLNFA